MGAFEDADVAKKALRREKAGLLVEDGAEELVCRAEALHQDVSFAVVDHLDSVGDGVQLLFDVYDSELGHGNAAFGADFLHERGVPDKGNVHETKVYGLGCRFDGVAVHAPRGDHPLADAFCLKGREKVLERGNHLVICGY